jgi:CRP/FNR family transcriptional regulator
MPLIDDLLARYPALAGVPRERLAQDLATVPVVEVPERTVLFRETEACQGFPFVLEGQVRVARGSPDGRELELYRVGPGEICVVSTGCLLGGTPMTAHGVAGPPTRLALVGRETLLGWTAFESVRTFLLGLMADRMAELMALVEAVAFQRLDQRIAHALLGRGRVVHTTHQRLADDVGTAREMVSRLLKRLEDRGILRLGREQIEILDPAELRALAGGGN